jgi:ankyrin repeat protein
MVALALMAGADVNSTGSNKTNALFFAVKYTSARCVEVLLDANVDVTQKDIYGHTMWKNAIERPDIHIIETLIRRCNEVIPISQERFTHNIYKQTLEYTMVDHMLTVYQANFQILIVLMARLRAPG